MQEKDLDINDQYNLGEIGNKKVMTDFLVGLQSP